MALYNPFKKSYTNRELTIFRFLKKIQIFSKLSFEDMTHVMPFMHLRKYKKDEVVFFRNDPSHAIYLIQQGIITLSIDLEHKFEDLGTLTPNKSFGDNALIPEANRIYNAFVTSESAFLYVIPQVNLLEIMNQYPKIKAKIFEAYGEQQNDYMERLFSTYKSSFGFFDLGQVYSKM